MNTLSLHIEYLLRHNDCVILPGIGAFLVQHHHAFVDHDAHLFMPASREVCFNASICSNDGLLAHSIARRERISYEEASIRLNEELVRLGDMLDHEADVTIGNIGALHKDQEGRLSFRRRYSAKSYAGLLGYYPLEKHEPLVIADDSLQSEDGTISAFDYRPDKYYYIAINKAAAKTAAVFACLIAICLGVFMVPFQSDNRESQFASVLPIETVTQVLTEKAEAKPGTKVEPKEPHILSETECTGRHYLIVGTFRTMQEVETYLRAMNRWDNDIEIIQGSNMFKISAFSSCDRSEVAAAGKSDTVTGSFSQSWIWSAH